MTANVLINGRGGADTVAFTGNGNFVLTDTLLSHTFSGVTSTVTMTGMTAATLTGGTAANKFTITGWTRPLSIAGAGDIDTVESTNDVDFELTPTSLQRSGLPNVSLAGVENALLTGGAADNEFTIGEWTGTATLNGAGGSDTLVVTDNVAEIKLNDTTLLRTNRGKATLSSIESAELTGGAANNLISAPNYSGKLKIDGLGGNDTLVSGSGTAIVFGGEGNDVLTAGSGPAVLVGGNGNDTLKVNATPLAGTTAGHTIMIGGAGTDTLTGGTGEDLLIDSSTDFDTAITDLTNLLLHWTAAGSYAARAAQLQTDLNGQLNPDGVADTLTGGQAALDLFFANLTGIVSVKDNLPDINLPTDEISVNNA